MYWVYVLYSEDFDKIYIGFTSDLEARLVSHNELAIKGWTIKYRPWKLLYSEEYKDKIDALKREKELKSYQGRLFCKAPSFRIKEVNLAPATKKVLVVRSGPFHYHLY